ncbi:MAG: hypothetical protein KDE00_11800 [Rhodobacteraceae bacterium]|nr:hypothetical protein [Paracoccaceae bacterium]
MGHIRLGTLPRSKNTQSFVEILEADAEAGAGGFDRGDEAPVGHIDNADPTFVQMRPSRCQLMPEPRWGIPGSGRLAISRPTSRLTTTPVSPARLDAVCRDDRRARTAPGA